MGTELEEKLLAAMLECGASSDLARIHAADFAAFLLPKIEREKRNELIRAIFHQVGADGVTQRCGIKRSMIYRVLRNSTKTIKQWTGSG